MVEPYYSIFRVITTMFLGVRIFRTFTGILQNQLIKANENNANVIFANENNANVIFAKLVHILIIDCTVIVF